MLVSARFPRSGPRRRATVSHGAQAQLQRLGDQPDGRRLRGHGVPAQDSRARHFEERQHEDHRPAAWGRDASGQPPEPESGSGQRSKGIRSATKGTKCGSSDGHRGEGRDYADHSDCAHATVLLGVHHLPARAEIPGVVSDEACGSAVAGELPGFGQEVPTRVSRCRASSGRDFRSRECCHCQGARNGNQGSESKLVKGNLGTASRRKGMQVIAYVVFVAAFVWLVVTVKSRRKFIAVTLTGVMVMTMVGVPQPAHAQSGILSGIQAILRVINGMIQTALTSINTVRTAVNNLQQVVAWPQQLINQAKAQITQMIGQYRNLMASIIHTNLKSATLPVPQSFETVVRDHQVNNFSSLTSAYGSTYGLVPVATAANSTDRAMSDMDDALALDSLKLLKASDQATDVEIQSADSIENAAGQAAPGSAPFLTATAIVSIVSSQALTQKMLAADLRQEAARLAHRNTLRKENASNTTQLRGVLVNLLQHQ